MPHFIAKLAILAFVTLLANPAIGKTSLYASNTGSDRADGTKEKPYSLQEALKISEANTTREIILLDGIYELDETINLSISRDLQSKLTIRALNPGRTTISGGLELRNPTTNKEGRIEFLKKNYPVFKKSRDLYIGNTRATRARSITYSAWNSNFSAIPGLAKTDTKAIDSQVKIDPSFPILDHTGPCPPLETWESPEDIEVVFRCAWWEKRCGIDTIKENLVTFTQPAWSILNTPWANEGTSRLNALMPKKTILEGAIELLDSPGEWHNGQNKISLIAPPSYNPEQDAIRLGQLETLIKIKNASGLRFEGIQFSHTTWNLPIHSTGFNEGQANFEQIGETGNPTEAIGIYNSSNIAFTNCSFIQLGGWGIGIFDKSSNVSVNSCVFLDTAASAVVIGSIESEAATTKEDQVTDIIISDTWIHKPASIYGGGVGIFVGYASNISIIGNEICHAPYTGISIGWGWNQFDNQPTQIHGNKVSGNYVHHYLYEMYDGGGIYTLGPQSNSEFGFKQGLSIEDNIVQNQGGIGNILYTDGGSSWITLQNNHTYNNLKELEDYYQWKAMYIPDWGGCSPHGNLQFIENVLGNYGDKSPNFRCAPSDPEPWNPSFRLPPHTRVEGNRFESKIPPENAVTRRSKHRHQVQENSEIGGIQAFSTSIERGDSSYINFTLSSDSDISIKSTALESQPKGILLQYSEPLSTWQEVLPSPSLPAGNYRLKFPEPSELESRNKEITISVSSQSSAISTIEATASQIQFATRNGTIQRYLCKAAGEIPPSIDLLAKSGDEIGTDKSWIDHPFHWQTLRAIIDAGLELPKHNSRASLYDLPAGLFTFRASEDTKTQKLKIISMSSHNL